MRSSGCIPGLFRVYSRALPGVSRRACADLCRACGEVSAFARTFGCPCGEVSPFARALGCPCGVAFGHRRGFFIIVPHRYSGVGHSRHFLRISSPWFSMYLNVIGYKQAFSIICSPRVSIRKENISSERTICAQSEDNHGEQFLIKPWLCPKIMKFSKIQGEQIIEIALLCPTPIPGDRHHHK